MNNQQVTIKELVLDHITKADDFDKRVVNACKKAELKLEVYVEPFKGKIRCKVGNPALCVSFFVEFDLNVHQTFSFEIEECEYEYQELQKPFNMDFFDKAEKVKIFNNNSMRSIYGQVLYYDDPQMLSTVDDMKFDPIYSIEMVQDESLHEDDRYYCFYKHKELVAIMHVPDYDDYNMYTSSTELYDDFIKYLKSISTQKKINPVRVLDPNSKIDMEHEN